MLDVPTADFSTDANICLNESLQVTYIGNAPTNSNFNWNFGNATITSGAAGGPYELEFPTNGSYDISLTVEENGCISDPVTKTVLVESPLAPPIISCTSTNTTVEFTWNDVPGTDSFDISVLTGQTGILNGRTYTVQNLNPGDTVEIDVTAVSTAVCPSVSTQLTCITQSCPAVDLRINNPGNFCVGNDKINLIANPTGGVGGGTIFWIGDGVQGDILDISGLTPGNYQITLEYIEGFCSYIETVDYKISASPVVSSKILSPLWYPGTIGSIDLTVSGGTMPYTFNWSNGTTTEDLTDVTRAVLHCVTVTDSEGCEERDCFEIGEGIFRINPINVACRNQPKRLSVRPSRGANFSWTPATDLSCDDCASPTVTASLSRFYNVTATLADGRTATQRVFVLVLPPGFCNTPKVNDLVNQKLTNSGLDFQNIQEEEFAIFEKEITETLLENSISITPNPTSGIVEIESLAKVLNIEVFDLSGKKLFTQNQKNSQDELSNIDLSGFSKGIYLLKINTNENTIVKRIMLMPK